MGAHRCHAQSGGTGGNRRRPNPLDEYAFAKKPLRNPHSVLRVTDEDRQDMGPWCTHAQPELHKRTAKILRIVVQPLAALRVGAGDLKGRSSRRNDRRRQCCRVDEAAGGVQQPVGHRTAAGDKRAESPQRLAQCSHLHRDPVLQALGRDHAASLRTHDAGRMRLIHHHHRVVALG